MAKFVDANLHPIAMRFTDLDGAASGQGTFDPVVRGCDTPVDGTVDGTGARNSRLVETLGRERRAGPTPDRPHTSA